MRPSARHRARLRADAKVASDTASLLAWGESKMQPMADVTEKCRRRRGSLSRRSCGASTRPRAGLLSRGARRLAKYRSRQRRNPKILVRVQGPTDDPADDEIIEVKKIAEFDGLGCLETPALQPTLRIIDGSKQARSPETQDVGGGLSCDSGAAGRGQHLRDWWSRAWILSTVLFTGRPPLCRRPRRDYLRCRRAARRGAIYRTGRRRGSSERKQALAATARFRNGIAGGPNPGR